LLIYIERLYDKNLKGIEDDLQLPQNLEILAYFWKFEHFAARIIVPYQSAFTVMADAVTYIVIQLLSVILYEVVKCRIKGMAHWVRAQGPPQGAPHKQRTFLK